MRLSTPVRRRRQSRLNTGTVGPPLRLRLAAGLVGLAMVGSLGVGSMVSAQAQTSTPEATAAAAAGETLAAAEPATDSGALLAPAPAEDAAPAEGPAPAEEVAATEEAAAPSEDAGANSPAPEEGPTEDPGADAAQQAPAAPLLKEAPQVQALTAPKQQLTCGSGVVYTINSAGKIRQVNTSNGNQTDVGSFNTSNDLNGLALAKDGSGAYAVPTARNSSNNMTVYRYDSATGETSTHDGARSISSGGTFVMGGINPATNIYYYGRVLNSKLELYAFNTANNTNIGLVGSIPVSNDSGWLGGTARGNGDLVFSSDGTMYFVASSNTTQSDSNVLMRVNQTLPTTAGDVSLTATKITNLNINNQARQFNGIAFEGGYLYLDTSAGHLYKVNASNGNLVGQPQTGLSSPVDMASCQYNNTLQVQKNIVARVGAGDQFTMTATVGGTQIGSVGTTTGSSTGPQTDAGTFASSVPTSGTTITIKEVGVAGTNLAQYTSSWVCRSADGAWTKKSEDGTSSTSGTFEFPAQSNAGVNVTCVFTNKPLSANVKVTKTWVNAVAGDTASFTANGETGTSTAPANGDVITTSFAQGTNVTVAEVLASANKGVYTTALKCTNATGTTVAEGNLTSSFTLGSSDVTCAYTNTNTAATVVVEKKWIVDGNPYDNGDQPEGISAALTLTGPGTAGATGQAWDTVRPGYFAGNTVTIAETTTFASGMTCELTNSAITPANETTTSDPVPHVATLAAGANSYTITNTVECTTVLTLLKFIDDSNGGSLVPGDFTLTATPEVGNALNFDGANTVTAANTKPVVASVNHALSESSHNNKLAYLQLSLQRYIGNFDAEGALADPDAWEDAAATNVSVATGHHEVYRFVNASVPTMTLPLTGGTGSIAYLMVGGGILLLALLVTAWILVRRGKANRA